MPPGWTRNVNSVLLLDSFTLVDKVKWEKRRSGIAKTCQACTKDKKSESIDNRGSISMARIFTKIIKDHPRGEELVKILLFCKHLALKKDSDFDPTFCSKLLSTSWSQLVSSPSPYLMHLLHFTKEELSELCRPGDGLLVRHFYDTRNSF